MLKHNRRNFYRLLQVQPDASVEIIKASYRTIMGKLKQHPDLGGSPIMASFINEAYEVLSDPEKRARYDQMIFRNILPTRPPMGKANTIHHRYPPGPLPQRSHLNLEALNASVGSIKKENGKKEHRSAPRILQQGLLIFLGIPHIQAFRGEIINFSPTGLRFRCPRKVEIGQIFDLQSPLFMARVKITNCRRGGTNSNYFCGAVFLSVEFMKDQGVFVSLTA